MGYLSCFGKVGIPFLCIFPSVSGSNIHFIHRRVKLLIDRGYRVVVHPAPYFLSYTNELSPEDVSTYRDKTYEVIVTR